MYATASEHDGRRSARCLGVTLVLAAAALVMVSASALAQTPIDPQTLADLRQAYYEQLAENGVSPRVGVAGVRGEAQLADGPLRAGGQERSTDLYDGLAAGGSYWYWAPGPYWALDDGTMGPSAFGVGGGEVTAYQFAFGVYADGPTDTLEPIFYVSFWNAALDPVAIPDGPIVASALLDPASAASSVAVSFVPITPGAEGYHVYLSALIDLAAADLGFNLDETFYVEIIPLKLQGGVPVFDPNIFAVFSYGPIILGTNQDKMWSERWVRQGSCDPDDLVYFVPNWYYDHPAEMDWGGCSPYLNQSPIRLVGDECPGPILELSSEPDDICVKPGEPVTVTLSQSCLPGLVRGYQAFLTFDPAALTFDSGSYITPLPYGLPIITPIAAVGGDIDLAAGIDDLNGQSPTSSTADLVTLNFIAGSVEGPTQVAFGVHDPPTRFSDENGNETVPTLVNLPTICVDGTPPAITCPPDLDLQCLSDVPAAATNLAEFVAQGGSASDSSPCGSGVTLTHEGDVVTDGSGCPGYPYIVERTYRATDCAGNFAECMQTITVIDNTPPLITGCPSNITVSNDPGLCSAVVSWPAPTASDNCGAVNLVFTHNPGDTFPVGTTTVTYTATDACGNITYCIFDVTVNDDEDPSIACPPNITQNADAGDCTAYVTVPAPTTSDNCGVASVVNDYTGTDDASDTYPSGITTVIWTVTDIHGNTNTCSHTVAVNAVNELVVDVQFGGTIVAGPITRCITFELWECPDTAPVATVSQTISFTSGLATGVLVPVPCGNYNCITARDTLHTLRRTDVDDFGIVLTQYVADFTDRSGIGGDDDALVGGGLNDDFWIDILDFGVFSSQWGANYGTGDTDCSRPPPHADVNGDGLVTAADFTFIQINFLRCADDNCCGQPRLGGGGGPITAISVEGLEAMGLPELAAGDLNGDGWLNQADIVEFLNGARPRPQPAPAEKIQFVPRQAAPGEPRP